MKIDPRQRLMEIGQEILDLLYKHENQPQEVRDAIAALRKGDDKATADKMSADFDLAKAMMNDVIDGMKVAEKIKEYTQIRSIIETYDPNPSIEHIGRS